MSNTANYQIYNYDDGGDVRGLNSRDDSGFHRDVEVVEVCVSVRQSSVLGYHTLEQYSVEV